MSESVLFAAAEKLAPKIRAHADEIERARRVPEPIVAELADAGLFRMLVPRALGGAEVTPATMIRAIEAVARADGSAGWCVMVGATSGLVSAYLEEDVAREVYGDPRAISSGVFAPTGTAIEEGDHYRVSGRWSFASGVEHAGHRMGGVIVMGKDGPLRSPSGEPVIRHVVLRAEDTQVIDTWNVSGLRGTGSHDMAVDGALVPKKRSAALLADRPKHGGALYRFPIFGLLALGVSAVAIGIAREAIEALEALAADKRPMWSKRTLARRELVQTHVAEAEAMVRAARAFLFDATAEVTAIAEAGGEVGVRERALLRLAATHATRAAAQVVDRMYTAGGGSAIYTTSPLQRYLRDVHVATQHVMVAEPTYTLIGTVLLGVHDDVGTL
jgi:alkylation response protein AidB-like acyl-CoA dehydrogenase